METSSVQCCRQGLFNRIFRIKRCCTKYSFELEKKNRVQKLFNGKTLSGWRIVEKNVYERHGKVEVKDGMISLGIGQPATGFAWAGEFPKIDYEISFEAQRVEGDDFFCGLTFPVLDSHCTLILGGWGGGATGISNVDQYSAIENETSSFYDFKNGVWYGIRLRVTKDKIEAWIEKEKIVELAVKDRKFSVWWEQEPVRPLGIGTWNTAAAFRNIILKPIKSQ